MSRNVAASVRERLRRLARESGLDAMAVMNRYVQERFLYRLSLTRHAETYRLKGGLSFAVVTGGATFRPTNDVDLDGTEGDGIVEIERMVRDVCAVDVSDDGVVFDLSSLKVRKEREGLIPGGKVEFVATLDTARLPMRVDVGFGNVVTPEPQQVEFPSLLDMPRPHISVYPLATTIAEKLHAMAAFGSDNTRLKDYYDLWFIASRLPGRVDGTDLANAVRRTFERQGRPVPEQMVGLSPEFAAANEGSWKGYVAKSRLGDAPRTLAETVAEIRKVAISALEAAREEGSDPPKP